MNKPFTLEEYKKNPGRLRYKYHDYLPRQSVLTVLGTLFVLSPNYEWGHYPQDMFDCFELATEYEVRRARPWRDAHGRVLLETSEDDLAQNPSYDSTWSWAGPEFEYKVEKY